MRFGRAVYPKIYPKKLTGCCRSSADVSGLVRNLNPWFFCLFKKIPDQGGTMRKSAECVLAERVSAEFEPLTI